MAGFQVYGGRIGAQDAVLGVMDLNRNGQQSLVYSTFFGGTGNEEVRGMAFDGKGNVIITGYTLSTDLPVVIEVVDTEEHIDRLLPILEEMLDDGLVTIEKVRVLRYKASHRASSV